MRPKRYAVLALGLAVVVVVGIGLLRGEASPPADSRPNIVLVILDTVRRDHLSLYGHERDTSPFLRKLAGESVVYTNAYSTSNWTAPAHAAILTGSVGFSPLARGPGKSPSGLAKILSGQGYRTVLLSENRLLMKMPFGFMRTEHFRLAEEVEECQTLSGFREVLAESDPRPLFCVINLMHAHSPYDNTLEAKGMFAKGSAIPDKCIGVTAVKGFNLEYTPDDFRDIQLVYDEGVRCDDDITRGIAGALKEAGMWDSTCFAVTSDHGEFLGERGLLFHGYSLYEEMLQVPLIVHYPEEFRGGESDDRLVQILDLFPTMLRVSGIDPAGHPSEGYDLAGPIPEGRGLLTRGADEFFLTSLIPKLTEAGIERSTPYRTNLKGIHKDGMKLVWAENERHEFYDLEADPDESRNLTDAHEKFGTLRAQLNTLLMKSSPGNSLDQPQEYSEREAFDAEQNKDLEDLGYL